MQTLSRVRPHVIFTPKLRQCAKELRRAVRQERKPQHLFVHARRAAIQAMRIVWAAIDAGQLAPVGLFTANRRKTLEDRLGENQLFGTWTIFACPWARSWMSHFKGGAGAFDFPRLKSDAEGRALAANGRPVRAYWFKGVKRMPASFKPRPKQLEYSWRTIDRIARVTDDYDRQDSLSHLRAQANDWADVCDAFADMIDSVAKPDIKARRHRTTTLTARDSEILQVLDEHHDNAESAAKALRIKRQYVARVRDKAKRLLKKANPGGVSVRADQSLPSVGVSKSRGASDRGDARRLRAR